MTVLENGRKRITHEKADILVKTAWDLFINVDGANCRKICPLPHSIMDNILLNRPLVEKYDNYSIQDRLNEINDQLTVEQKALFIPIMLNIAGASLDKTSLFDVIHWHALCSYNAENFYDFCLRFKLKTGQTGLASKIFQEAVSYGLQYSFSTPITEVNTTDHISKVFLENGSVLKARRVICTIPLNVLHTIKFKPPLDALKQEAIDIGHITYQAKLHVEAKGSEKAYTKSSSPDSPLCSMYADQVLPNGNSHLCFFGRGEKPGFNIEKDIEESQKAVLALDEIEIQRFVFHDWNGDPFSYGGAGPCWRPGYMTKFVYTFTLSTLSNSA